MASIEPRKASEEVPMALRAIDNRITRAACKSARKLAIVTSLGSVVLACSSSNNQGSTGATVGGGTGTGVGGGAGAKATGGGGAQVGGASSTGGSTATGQGGNTAQAGASTGGTNSASSATGGAATGGTATSTGGAATGGAATGGNSATAVGGSATGGAGTGGAATGGSSATATGGAATGGTSSCAAATITMISSADYQLKSCNVTLDVNPQIGARITNLTITPSGSAATGIILPYACTGSYNGGAACNNSGSTFWTSPQSAWPNSTWPPVAAIDGNAYAPNISGSDLILTGSADTALGASVTKDFSADATTGWISLKYTINATKSIQVAPWQITRVPRGGLVFFPMVSLVSNTITPTWTLSPLGGYGWIDDSSQSTVSSSSGAKVIADGGSTSGQGNTWLAYVLSRNLFLIKYPDVLANKFAPNEGDTEVYPGGTSGNPYYIELEAQGAYTTIAANASLSWTANWLVLPIPSSVTVSAGSTSLISFVQQNLGN